MTDLDTDPFKLTEHRIAGTAKPSPPAGQNLWRVQASGTGTQTITWPVEKGRWSAVVMNADASRDVSIALRIGARVSALKWVALGLLTGGGLLLLIGASLIYAGTQRQRPEATRVIS